MQHILRSVEIWVRLRYVLKYNRGNMYIQFCKLIGSDSILYKILTLHSRWFLFFRALSQRPDKLRLGDFLVFIVFLRLFCSNLVFLQFFIRLSKLILNLFLSFKKISRNHRGLWLQLWSLAKNFQALGILTSARKHPLWWTRLWS